MSQRREIQQYRTGALDNGYYIAQVEEYARTDPYSKGNLIADYTIRPYIRVQ